VTKPRDLANSVNTGPLAGTRNRIINGDMRIDQRTAGASQLLADTGIFKVDRWSLSLSTGLYSKLTAGRDLNAVALPAGFTSYLGLEVTTAATPVAADFGQLRQAIEGFNIAGLNWGTANALPVTLSFRVRASVTGTYAGVLQNSGSTHTYAFTYAVSAANTWETKTVTIPGPTVGSWNVGNGIGAYVTFNLGTGSTQSTATVGSWIAGNFLNVTGTVNLVANAAATWYLAGVQLEEGPIATAFERRGYQQELAMCQRYFEAVTYPPFYMPGTAATLMYIPVYYKTTKRTSSPNITLPSSTNAAYTAGGSNATPTTWTVLGTSADSTSISIGNSSLGGVVTGTMTVSAEL
jgi:hypothetical protein